MPKLVVVEGPDGAGKSTLVRKLSLDLGLSQIHSGGPPATVRMLDDKFNLIEDTLRAHPRGVLVDRHPAISEPIYRNAKNEPLLRSAAMMMAKLEALHPIVIYCRTQSLTDMWQSIDRRSKPHKPQEHLESVLRTYKAIVDSYDQFFADPDLGFLLFRYDWRVNSYQHLLEHLKQCVASS